jgi:hypothetical protein
VRCQQVACVQLCWLRTSTSRAATSVQGIPVCVGVWGHVCVCVCGASVLRQLWSGVSQYEGCRWSHDVRLQHRSARSVVWLTASCGPVKAQAQVLGVCVMAAMWTCRRAGQQGSSVRSCVSAGSLQPTIARASLAIAVGGWGRHGQAGVYRGQGVFVRLVRCWCVSFCACNRHPELHDDCC